MANEPSCTLFLQQTRPEHILEDQTGNEYSQIQQLLKRTRQQVRSTFFHATHFLFQSILSHQLILELDLIRLGIMCPSNLYNNFVALRSSHVILSMGHVQGSSTVDQQLLERNLTYYQKHSHESHPQSLISTRRTSEYKNPCTIINIDMKLQQISSKR